MINVRNFDKCFICLLPYPSLSPDRDIIYGVFFFLDKLNLAKEVNTLPRSPLANLILEVLLYAQCSNRERRYSFVNKRAVTRQTSLPLPSKFPLLQSQLG